MLEARWYGLDGLLNRRGGLPLWLPGRSPEDRTRPPAKPGQSGDPVHPIGSPTPKSSVSTQPRSPCIYRRSAPSDPNAPHAPFSQLRLIVVRQLLSNLQLQTPLPTLPGPGPTLPLLLKSPTSPKDRGQRNMT
jgi:hypothetical protein